MSAWQEIELASAIKTNQVSVDAAYPFQEILYLDTGSITKGKIDELQSLSISSAPSRAKRLVKDGDIVYSTVRPIQRHYGYIQNPPANLVVSTGFAVITCDNKKLDSKFLYYYLSSDSIVEELDIIAEASTSTYPSLKPSDIEKLTACLPVLLDEQKAIAAVFSSIDDKIDLLHRQNKTLEAMAGTLFRQWFVEEAQKDWEEVRLGDFFPVVTGKKDANFSTDDGEYPFFTCSQTAIKAPSFSFDGAAILLAGNGDFNVKRYSGKFEAYQRTYVLIPYDVKYFSFLFTLMSYYLSDITGGHQGSVINFITKGMITDFTFSMPKDRGLISKKLEQFNEIYEKVDSNTKQIRTLEKLRDTLLPKLMSGEVRVEFNAQ